MLISCHFCSFEKFNFCWPQSTFVSGIMLEIACWKFNFEKKHKIRKYFSKKRILARIRCYSARWKHPMKNWWTEDRIRTNFKLLTSKLQKRTFFEVSYETIDFRACKSRFFVTLNLSSMLFQASCSNTCCLKVNRCGLFRKVQKKLYKMSYFWENLRNQIFHFILSSILNSWVRLNFSFVGSGPSGQVVFLDN